MTSDAISNLAAAGITTIGTLAVVGVVAKTGQSVVRSLDQGSRRKGYSKIGHMRMGKSSNNYGIFSSKKYKSILK